MDLFLNFLLIFLFFKSCLSAGLMEVLRWKQIDFHDRSVTSNTNRPVSQLTDKIFFPGDHRRKISSQSAMSESFSYNGYNNIPMGATHFEGRLFVSIPRRRIGVPSTVNYINLEKSENDLSPLLHSFKITTTVQNSLFITSVYRTKVDSCQRLWFVDTGMLEYPNNRQHVQRPSIWIVDLNTDQLIKRIEVPSLIVQTGEGLASITIDVNNCSKSFAYIPDLVNSQLLVYSFENDKIWSFDHNYFHFDPLAGDFSIGGQQFRWRDGIFSVTIGSQQEKQRFVYFHAMASNNEYVVSNVVLQNETNSVRSYHGTDFRYLGYRGVNRQSTMHQFDPLTNTIFYAEIHRNGVGCWKTSKSFSSENHGTVATDSERMVYPSDLTIDENGIIWVITNSMPIFLYSQLNPKNFNFRIWRQQTTIAVQSTICV